METIKKYDNIGIDLKSHIRRVGDIINMEGPLLSLFQDERNSDFYLFDWADSDSNTNRWLIYKILPETLNQFLHNRISYKKMFDSIKSNEFYYADITNSEKIDYSINRMMELPKNYLPTKETFFDRNDSKDYYNIITKINQSLVREDSGNTASINKVNYIDNLPIDEFLPSFYHQEIRTSKPEGEIESINLFPHNFLTKIDTQQYVRESNRLPRKKGVDSYPW